MVEKKVDTDANPLEKIPEVELVEIYPDSEKPKRGVKEKKGFSQSNASARS